MTCQSCGGTVVWVAVPTPVKGGKRRYGTRQPKGGLGYLYCQGKCRQSPPRALVNH